MQISRKALVERIQRYVSDYQASYNRGHRGDYFYYEAASAVSALMLLFPSDEVIHDAYETARDQIANIWINGDEDDYSRLKKSADTVSSVVSECLGSNGIGEDSEATTHSFEEKMDTPILSDPLKQVDWAEDLPALPSSRCSGIEFDVLQFRRFSLRHLDSVSRFLRCSRPGRRGVRLPQEYDYSGCFRYSINRGLSQ